MLQRFIDLNYFNTNRLIDIVALCNTKRFFIDSTYNQYGVHLTSDVFFLKCSYIKAAAKTLSGKILKNVNIVPTKAKIS